MVRASGLRTVQELSKEALGVHRRAKLTVLGRLLLVERATRTAETLAKRAVGGLVGELRSAGHQVAGAGVALGLGRRLGTLARILASHAVMHAAEGELCREALVHAGVACDLPVTGVPEHDLHDCAAAALRLPIPELRRRVVELGRSCGPPVGAGPEVRRPGRLGRSCRHAGVTR